MNSVSTQRPDPKRRIEVMRAFFFNGVIQKVGTVLEVPQSFGADVVSFGRARWVADAPVKAG